MKKLNKIWETIITSSAFGVIALPVTLFYTIMTWRTYKIEAEALRDAIEDSEDFFTFLNKMGFVAAKWGTALIATHPYNVDLSEPETYEVARTNMQKFIVTFFESEQLLDVVNLQISINPKKTFVTTVLKPATYDIHFRNVIELSISILLWSSVAVFYLLY